MTTRRHTSLFTGLPHLERLFRLERFPVFMGCVSTPPEDDMLLDLSFSICRDTGLIQLDELPPAEVIYQLSHNDSTGTVWSEHHRQFAEFVRRFPHDSVIEVGGAAGRLAKEIHERDPLCQWTIVEPNPLVAESDHLHLVHAFFEPDLPGLAQSRMVVHSHVLEHAFDVEAFFATVGSYLEPGGYQIFSVPNLAVMLDRKYTNCLNFEHTVFIAENYIDAMLERAGFSLLEKSYFRDDHSIFYATRWDGIRHDVALPNDYQRNRARMEAFRDHLQGFVERINQRIADFDGPLYLFGAHIFSQYLLAFGLKTDKLRGILDNSPIKVGKRLYGTDFQVYSPEVLRGQAKAGVILNVAQYRDEIVNQITAINANTVLFE